MSLRQLAVGAATLWLAGCAASPRGTLPTVPQVDLPRFMGDWYVIANIPTRLEVGAHNAVETYALRPDGTIDTTFTFRAGSFDGPVKRYTPRGFVRPGTGNAHWGMRFVWPIKADYRIVYLSDDYAVTAIGRDQRDYLWIMARTPQLDEDHYRRVVDRMVALGYDPTLIRRVPQRWP